LQDGQARLVFKLCDERVIGYVEIDAWQGVHTVRRGTVVWSARLDNTASGLATIPLTSTVPGYKIEVRPGFPFVPDVVEVHNELVVEPLIAA
jgi:hypothetical protein